MLVSRSISMWSLPAIGCWNPFAFARFRVSCTFSQLPVSPKDKTLRTIYNSGVIACLRASSAELAMSAACAALNGGVSVLEIVMSTPGVLEVLQQLLQDYPTRTLGVGTVLNVKDAKNAVEAGAKFLMSPTMVNGIMDDIEGEFLYIPGVMTPTEVLTAYEAGAQIVKVYPVSALGGIKYISALKKPFPHISMVASQGITIESTGDYIREGASSVVLSDAIFNKEFMKQKNFDGISQLSKLAASRAMEALEWKQQSSLNESCH
ncbi:KHG/KDPG aldolase isoform X2 [Cucurbita maxima]|uniref:KHG/KDPG aldolase isoform X2 n=2 Tax=Cucurbita maxima TaxID=3661 RepID=A0A6J1JPL6_CUCMA|nr:KHG/KDPG aldolase isoform X2 [Cucurbita maxima]XP_022989542.1 KHG/KDPG aldolase isoform X2 [Cucurbita maxima]XP_022989545.1 KHG/KDPG aldolase isoform X2 [Cucurbita maxima]